MRAVEPRTIREVVKQSRDIEGWFSPAAAGLFGLLDMAQPDVRSDLFEIGAHHGKSAVLLARMTRSDETLCVCDIFEDQAANVSASGAGNRAVFERNIATIAPGARTQVFQTRSSELTPEAIGGPYRFFHIDGGHLREEARADLELAASVLAHAGVIVVDDPFQPEWPGVTEAILEFCGNRPEFEPVALGFNKLVIARRESRARYEALIASDEACRSSIGACMRARRCRSPVPR